MVDGKLYAARHSSRQESTWTEDGMMMMVKKTSVAVCQSVRHGGRTNFQILMAG